MQIYSPKEGLSGLQEESGANLTPEQLDAPADRTNGLKARLAATVAKVTPLLTAASLLTATGCSDEKTDNQPAPAPTAVTPQPKRAEEPENDNSGPFAYKAVCEAHNLLDSENKGAKQNYRRMFIQMVIAGEPVIYEPCAESNLSDEAGQFVDADCKNKGDYRICTVKDSYINNRYETVNTETMFKWLLNGEHEVESPNSVKNVFHPYDVNARKGQNIIPVNPNASLIYGQRKKSKDDKRRAVKSNPTPTPAVTNTKVRETTPTHNPETNRRLDNLEAQVSYNTSKNEEQDNRLNAHEQAIQIIIDANSGSKPLNPHPTSADYTDLGGRVATDRQ